MGQYEVELILARQLASYLAMPIVIIDAQGNLIFYNELAEAVMGRRFEETGELASEEWPMYFEPTDDEGKPMPLSEMPLTIALRERRPVHRAHWIRGLDGQRRHVEGTAFPLIGQEKRFLGAMAIFWEK
jgi:PAS domain S-box-containing protein